MFSDPETLSRVTGFFDDHPSCDYIRYQWQDYSGILRARILTKKYCLGLVSQGKPARCADVCFSALPNNSRTALTPGSSHALYADYTSLRVFQPPGSALQYATVMCFVEAELPTPLLHQLEICPRMVLQNIVGEARKNWGLGILLGFEIEFYVMKRPGDGTDALQPATSDPLGFFSAVGFLDPMWRHFEEAISRLKEAGIHFQSFHVEGPSGQYEVALDPLPPLQAIDELLLAHHIIKSTFAAHDLIATMVPKPIKQRSASGTHVHISIGNNKHQREFLAGMLERLTQICAITLPTSASYSRVKQYEAGDTVSWGTENRNVPIRKIKDGHWEVRCLDMTANMYLAAAMLVAAGIEGIESKAEPPPEARSEKVEGNLQMLPKSYKVAIAILKGSLTEWKKVLRSTILYDYVRLKEREMSMYEGLTEAELLSLMIRWY